MSWFSFRSKEAATRTGAASTQTLAEPEVHRSLALPTVFEAMARGSKANVLDLGSAVGSNVEHLSQYGCKLSIEDLYQTRTTAADGAELGADFFEQLGRTVRIRRTEAVHGVHLLGDNRAYRDEDSRDFGDVDPATCIGQVFARFSPAEGVTLPEEISHGWLEPIY